jgi:hypothetical protein
LYRYRLGVLDQVSRIDLATQAVMAERKLIASDEYDLLFAPSMSHEDFVAQLETSSGVGGYLVTGGRGVHSNAD